MHDATRHTSPQPQSLIPYSPRQIGAETIQSVNGRDLHDFLQISRDYNDWMRTQIERAHLVENRDYGIFYMEVGNSKRGRPKKEYALSFDAAKHVAMLSGSPKGHEVREYFIACEKALKEQLIDPVEKYPELRAIRELVIATAEARDEAALARKEAAEAKEDAAQSREMATQALNNQQWLSVTQYVETYKLTRQMPPGLQSAYGRWLTGYCHEKGKKVYSIRNIKGFDENTYHIQVIQDTLPGWLMRRDGQQSLRILPEKNQKREGDAS